MDKINTVRQSTERDEKLPRQKRRNWTYTYYEVFNSIFNTSEMLYTIIYFCKNSILPLISVKWAKYGV